MTENTHPFIYPGLPLAAMLAVGALVGSAALADGPDAENGEPTTNEVPAAEEPEEAADNSYCYVCHVNWEKEHFVEQHRLKGVGCCDCHGDCEAHMDDEEGNAPPDVMFAKDKINASCMDTCHTIDKLAGVADHIPYVLPGKEKKKPQLCTDCHGKHRLEKRTRVWNQETGKLIEVDGKPVVTPKPAAD